LETNLYFTSQLSVEFKLSRPEACPRMLECLHVFCTECLQRIQLPAISCPLCRHPTTLETGDPLTLPCNSRILAQLPPMAFRMPTSVATRLATVTQSVVLSLEASRDSRFIILPTVSLRVEQMHPSDRPHSGGGGLVDEVEVLQHHRRTLVCVQLLAVVFWVLFGVTCIVAVVFGPSFFCK
uniref:RING-type domain-containing protein n=1 Tax=Oncorhynchus tshawytscha TaxID=74940 RepID=A0A8C8MBP5_ONCTS